MTETDKRFLLLYGSQTGQARAIAEQICEKCMEAGFLPDIHCISDSDKKFNIEKETIVVIVVSTTGDGEPPDTVNKFWRKLKKRSNPPDMLNDVKYALLGLGDSNYTNFCNMGKMLNEKLLQLGAIAFYEPGFADDGVGLEIVVEPWITGLLPALTTVFTPSDCKTIDSHLTAKQEDTSIVQPSDSLIEASTDLPTSRENIDNLKSKQEEKVTEEQSRRTHISDSISQLSLNNSLETAIDMFFDSELSLRGDVDDKCLSKPFTVASYPPSYIDLTLTTPMSLGEFDYSVSVQGATMRQCPVAMASILQRTVLTSQDARKKTLELTLSWKEDYLEYKPGDAVCIIAPNDSSEVQYLIERLNLKQVQSDAISIGILKETSKRNPVIPKHIPPLTTVLDYFKHCADIRPVLKKGVLLGLSEYCSNDAEKKRLQWLSSRQGSQDYNKLVLEGHLDILDILHAFPSCVPPLARLIELIPRLQPRYYSAASSPLASSQEMKIVFNVTVLPNRTWQKERTGLCSGWLDRSSCRLPSEINVPLFGRLNNPFSLPLNNLLPIIMVGPGTGIAPFIGFLEHRYSLRNAGIPVGPSWLFFGCRHPDKDYLYKDRLLYYASQAGDNILRHLHTSFSQLNNDDDSVETQKYVQDNIRKYKLELSKWIMEDNAIVYICGDAKNMAKNIKEAITEVIQHYIDTTGDLQKVACDIVQELVETRRYVVDQWI